MKARLLFRKRIDLSESAFVEAVVWLVPQPVKGSTHNFKYSLALVADGVCVLRYDNEAGKGDHKHVGGDETSHKFTTLDSLQNDFWDDVEAWRDANEHRYP